MSIQELVNYLDHKGCQILGCTSKEIDKIEKYFSVVLPNTYKEYLAAMGHNAGKFMYGSSAFIGEIFILREGCERLLIENNFKPLPDDAFVFWMHQGYQFAFFYLDKGDNPQIFFYSEGVTKGEFEKKEESLTDFLENQLAISGL